MSSCAEESREGEGTALNTKYTSGYEPPVLAGVASQFLYGGIM